MTKINKIFSVFLAMIMAVSCFVAPMDASAAVKKPAQVTITNVKAVQNKTNLSISKNRVSWKKVKGVSGYQVKISKSKKFPAKKAKSVAKISTKTTYTTTAKASATSKNILKLKNGNKYYVKVRAYKTVKGKNVYGKWSKVKGFTAKTKYPSSDPRQATIDSYAGSNYNATDAYKDTSLGKPTIVSAAAGDEIVTIKAKYTFKEGVPGSLVCQISKTNDFSKIVINQSTINGNTEFQFPYGNADQYALKPKTTYYVRMYFKGSGVDAFTVPYSGFSNTKDFTTGSVGRADVENVFTNITIKNESSRTLSGKLLVKDSGKYLVINEDVTIQPSETFEKYCSYTVPRGAPYTGMTVEFTTTTGEKYTTATSSKMVFNGEDLINAK